MGGQLESGRHHPDDRGRIVVQRERAPHDGGVRPETTPPQAVAQQHRHGRAGPIVVRAERPAARWRHAQERERSNVRAPGTLGCGDNLVPHNGLATRGD